MVNLFVFCIIVYELCFMYIGVDYFGLLNVKRGWLVVKRWGVIFICLNFRVVYLEVVIFLEIDCFINVFRRFINWRGLFKCMYFDNGFNFVGVEREIIIVIEDWN